MNITVTEMYEINSVVRDKTIGKIFRFDIPGEHGTTDVVYGYQLDTKMVYDDWGAGEAVQALLDDVGWRPKEPIQNNRRFSTDITMPLIDEEQGYDLSSYDKDDE